MKYYVIINGNSSLNIQGLAIESLPNISKPLIRTTREEIDGRDGDIITKLGYSAYDKTLNIGLWGNYDINEVIAFFNQEGVITFSNEPDKYYKFTIVNRIDFVNELEKFKKASITIHCQPFKYQEQTEVVAEEEAVELTGTSFNITDSLEAPLLMDLKGNTSQNTLSGKNLFDINTATLDKNTLSEAGISLTFNSDGTIVANGTNNGTYKFLSYKLTLPAGTYYYSGCPQGGSLNGYSTQVYDGSTYYIDLGDGATFTLNSTKTIQFILIRIGNQTITFNKKVFKPMIAKVSVSYNDYEPYCGGIPSPNPSYPQNVNVVSGDNDIVVCGKNLFDNEYATGRYDDSTGAYVSDNNSARNKNPLYVSPNTSYCFSNNGAAFDLNIFEYKNDGTFIKKTLSRTTFITDSETAYINFSRGSNLSSMSVEIEKGTTLPTYTPYTGTTYNIDLPVENMINLDDINVNNAYETDSIKVLPNKTYTISYTKERISGATISNNQIYGVGYIVYYNSSTEISRENGTIVSLPSGSTNVVKTFTTPNNCNRIIINIGNNNGDTNVNTKVSNIQIEQGSKANTYTPYGTTPIELCKIGTYQDYFYKEDDKWYLHKEVGKVVLDGSEDESWSKLDNSSYSSTILRFRTTAITNVYKVSDNTISIMSDYFEGKLLSVRNTNSIARQLTDVSGINIFIDKNYLSGEQTSNFKTWLGTHNTNVYYVLDAPTNTEITYQPLLNQLNALEDAESYEGTTNINQVNNDLPFILGLTYFTGDNTITITNDGNIYSKPLLRIKGTSDISISLNGIQIFQITLQNNEIIIIDTEKMEAYYDGILKNRQVIGDYNNFKLNPGENTIEINGAFDYVRISRYSRWV